MKCHVCGFEGEFIDEEFLTIDGMSVDFYACPKCGTVRIADCEKDREDSDVQDN